MHTPPNDTTPFIDALGSQLAVDDLGYVSPVTVNESHFVFGFDDGAPINAFKDYAHLPTAVLYKDGSALNLWAFDAPISKTDPALIDLADALGMDGVDEPIPTPGVNGWSLEFLNGGTRHSLDALADTYVGLMERVPTAGPEGEAERASEAQPASAGESYGDAVCITPYDEKLYSKEITITFGGNRQSKQWKPVTLPAGAFIAMLSKHKDGQKDGQAFVLGDLVAGQRLKTSVKVLYGVGLDIDTGTPTDTVDAALKKLGNLAIRYSTHSSGKTKTEIKKDKVVKFAGDREIDSDLMQEFLNAVELWDPSIVQTVEYLGTEHTEKGIVCQVSHIPMPKHRIVILFKEPFDINKEAPTQAEAMKKWAKVPEALARLLSVPFDTSCTDPSRLFYFPRHAKGKPFGISLFGGDYFDWRTLELDDPMDRLNAAISKGKSKSVTDEGRELGRWSLKRAHGFQIADVVESFAPDRIRHNTGHGIEIECPFDEDHSNAGDTEDRACLAVNAGEGPSEFFTISCRHETCRDKTNLDMLGKMLTDGWFPNEVTNDEQFNAILEGEGKPEPNGPPQEVFEFDDEDELVKAINAKCAVAPHGDEVRFVFWDKQNVPIFRRKRDAETALAKYRFFSAKLDKDGNETGWKELSGFSVWLRNEKRREYDAVVFNPKTSAVAVNELNLWTGLAISPAPGDWSLMREHIFENICQHNQEHFDYLMDWMSQMFREPEIKSGVVVVLRGEEGVGKSKLGDWLRKIVGKRHSLVVDKAEQLTGKFNSHLEQALFVLAEEALFAGDPKAKNALKHLATGQDQSYEGKGKDTRSGESYCRVMMPTNEEWAVPVGVGDRRYFVLDVGSGRKEDKAYFAAIDNQMNAGGAAAMLHDLLAMDVSYATMGKPPMTDAKKDQISLGMSARMKWLASVLADGEFSFKRETDRASVEWPAEGGEVPKNDVFDSYRDFAPGFRSMPSSEEIGRFLQKHVPELKATRPTVMGQRVWHYKLPSLEAAKAAFLAATPGYSFPSVTEVGSDMQMPSRGSASRTGAVGSPVAALDEHRARKSVG